MKALYKILFVLFFPFFAIAQIDEAHIVKTEAVATNESNVVWNKYVTPVLIGGKTYCYGIDGTSLLFCDLTSTGELINRKEEKNFFDGKPLAHRFVVGENLVVIWWERNKDRFLYKAKKINLKTKSISEDIVIVDILRGSFYETKIGVSAKDQIYFFFYDKPDRDGLNNIHYFLFDSNLSQLVSIEKKIPLVIYKSESLALREDFFRSIFIDNQNQMYLIVEQKNGGKRGIEIRCISPDGKHQRISVDLAGLNIPNFYIKQLGLGETYLAGFASFEKKRIPKELLLWKLDVQKHEFLLDCKQTLNLFEEEADEKVIQYMMDFNPGRKAVPLRYEFIPKDIYILADGSKIVVGRGFALSEAVGHLSGYYSSAAFTSLIAEEAQPGFVCCKLDKNNKLLFAKEFSTQYFLDNNNSLAIEKNGNIYALFPYHKGYYVYGSTNPLYIPDELKLVKISNEGVVVEQILANSANWTSSISKSDSEFLVRAYAVENKKSTNTFYDKKKESSFYKIEIK